MLCSFLTIVGALATINWLYENLRSPILLIWGEINQLLGNNPFPKRYGKWAVITGSSDGIGRGYAYELARKGMNVMLVSRTESKLQKIAQDIKAKYGVEAKYIAVDFAKGEAIYDQLEKALVPLDVGILVNNVGLMSSLPETVHESSKTVIWGMINVNVAAATALCRMLVPSMRERRRGLIVNISSILSVAPTPYVAIYAATKAYMTSFSLALQEELKSSNIEVQTVLPGGVQTNMTETMLKNTSTKALTSGVVPVDAYTKFAGCTVGKTDLTTGHWMHAVQLAGLYLLPTFVRTQIMKHIYENVRNDVSNKRG